MQDSCRILGRQFTHHGDALTCGSVGTKLLGSVLYLPQTGYDTADDGPPNCSSSRRIGISSRRVQGSVSGLHGTQSAIAEQVLFWDVRSSCQLIFN